VIESGIERSKGCFYNSNHQREIKKGDLIIVGEEFGKARLLLNEHNDELDAVTPSLPVKVYGLSLLPMQEMS
jgi:translation initiation factor IF-2